MGLAAFCPQSIQRKPLKVKVFINKDLINYDRLESNSYKHISYKVFRNNDLTHKMSPKTGLGQFRCTSAYLTHIETAPIQIPFSRAVVLKSIINAAASRGAKITRNGIG